MAGRYKDGQKKKKRHIVRFVVEILLVLILALGVFLFWKLKSIGGEKLDNIEVNEEVVHHNGYKNYVLYGVDSREGRLTEECHSDTIIICSLNVRSKEVKMVSVYRDTYLDNTNGEFRKAAECYYFGGPSRSINMLNKNFDLDISDYVTVNFQAVIKMVDLIGGVDLEITEEEMEYINGYCVENEQVTGVGYTPLTEYGYVHLDGIQALAYCRIRYTEGWDFKRTERQRQILSLIYRKARQQGITSLVAIANAMIPEISTSMNAGEIISLVQSMGTYSLGGESGFPFEQTPMTLETAGDVVVPVNLASNVSQLHEMLYGEQGYEPSETVREISSQISEITGVY